MKLIGNEIEINELLSTMELRESKCLTVHGTFDEENLRGFWHGFPVEVEIISDK